MKLLSLEMLPLIPHSGHFQMLHVDVVLCAPHVNLPIHFFVMNYSNKSFACCLLTLYNINILSITTIFFLTYAKTKNFLNFINDERMRISVNTFELVLFCKWIQNISTQYPINMLGVKRKSRYHMMYNSSYELQK